MCIKSVQQNYLCSSYEGCKTTSRNCNHLRIISNGEHKSNRSHRIRQPVKLPNVIGKTGIF